MPAPGDPGGEGGAGRGSARAFNGSVRREPARLPRACRQASGRTVVAPDPRRRMPRRSRTLRTALKDRSVSSDSSRRLRPAAYCSTMNASTRASTAGFGRGLAVPTNCGRAAAAGAAGTVRRSAGGGELGAVLVPGSARRSAVWAGPVTVNVAQSGLSPAASSWRSCARSPAADLSRCGTAGRYRPRTSARDHVAVLEPTIGHRRAAVILAGERASHGTPMRRRAGRNHAGPAWTTASPARRGSVARAPLETLTCAGGSDTPCRWMQRL